ncbi:MAG: putative zinc-binding metallopeptidase, partial [Planctomycetota bacterium]
RLERKMMFEVEGGTERECMKILRHEAGHAICNGYRLHYRKRWREVFGKFSERYPTYYRPKPKSRDYVLHLDWWYAQSHPAEDFAETFAVWLRPSSRWRKAYAGWPALRKLQCVDEMMKSIEGEVAPVRSRQHAHSVRKLRTTLRAHYRRRQRRYADDPGDLYDRDLKRLFSDEEGHARNPSAAQFLRRNKGRLRTDVAEWAGVHPYTVDRVIQDMITRSRKLQLRVRDAEADLLSSALLMIAIQTVYLVQGGRRLVAL